jgi:hypothetical protein
VHLLEGHRVSAGGTDYLIDLHVYQRIGLVELSGQGEYLVEHKPLGGELENGAALLYDICDMPEELVVGLILLDCGSLRFLDFDVDRRRSEIKTHRDSLNLLKAKVTVLIRLEFQGDHILSTLLGIEHVESKGQVGLILRPIVISDCI